jgi:1-acyl-sn-glycerol-3-phosphate acyltransferase
MNGFFLLLYRFFSKNRIIFFSLIIIGGFITAYLASRITLEEDISKAVPGENDKIARIINNSRLTNKLIINIFLSDTSKAADPDKLIAFSDELTDSLRNRNFGPYIDQSTIKISDSLVENMMGFFYENIPLFLSENDYQKIDSLLLPEMIDKSLEKNFKTLISPTSFILKKYIQLDPIGISSLALNKLKQFQFEDGYSVIGGYVFTANKKNLLLFLDPANSPSETLKNAVFFKKLDKLLKVLSGKVNYTVKAEYYGASAVAVGNAEQIKKDIVLTVTIAILLILLFIGWFFRKASIPFISFLPAIFGGIAALAAIFIIKAKMSTIALGIGSVLLGIIVDYALYIYSVYKAKGSIEQVVKDISTSIVICSLTSTTVFFSLLFVKSEVLRDLGLFAGLSIFGAALFSLTILPHLVRMKNIPSDKGKPNPVEKIAAYKFESNNILVIIILVITIVMAFFSKKAGFDTDMYSMNYLSPKMKEAEKRLNKINDISLKSIYIASTGDNLDQALTENAKVMETLKNLKNKDIVKKYTNVGTILINDSIQKERIQRWKDYWSFEKRKKLENTIIKASEQYGFKKDAFKQFYFFLTVDIQPIDISRFSAIRSLFLNDMITEAKDFTMVLSLVKVNNENRHKVYTEFSGEDNAIVIDRQEITSGFVNSLRSDFNLLVRLCLIFVTLFLILSFGRIEIGIIASIPMFVSWLWTLGFMGIFDIKFNIINIIVSTFVFGLGVDYSILMMQGFLLEYKYGHKEMTSYKISIFLSSFTTIIGVSVLLLAKHPSLNSIALISLIGLISVVLISYTIMPIMYRWLVSKKNNKRLLPVTLSDIVLTIAVFSIFLIGCLFMNLMLFVVLLLPIPSKNKRLLMHRGMALWCKIPVYAMLHIKKKIVNQGGEDFSKPALILSNHQSHIDLLLLLMLHPKLIVLTTKWVWNNPIYALVIRYLNYYAVIGGYEELTDKLKLKIDEGYSMIVFPEGSRSPDSTIRRFHKGAFLMAEKFGLDLLPVFIHGAGDCMNKSENHLRGGSITVKIYPRVKPGDRGYGADYHEMTRSMLTFYRKEYEKMKEELETPGYFRKKLIRNYIYKGPVLEWYTRIKLSLEGNYKLINSNIPRDACIVDIGCGYGYLSYMLSFVSEKRIILGIDYDADKVEIANNCISKNDRVNFVTADAAEYAFKNADVFILSDVLHYLPEEMQDVLLEKCIGHLNPNGKIIIRDADRDLEKRHRGTRYTEFFSTRSGFNKADQNRLYFFSGRKIRDIATRHGFQTEVIDNSRLTSNMLFVLRKK